jgi:thiol-disulfide isomerase/thioredoxin
MRQILTAVAIAVTFLSINSTASAQKAATGTNRPTAARLPVVKQIDAAELRSLIKPDRKPLLINFWATWCDPCREEFPDLVKIRGEFGDKIDFILVSLDDLAEINGDVPKFLAEMKAEMPAYLLKTPDENEAISAVSKDWKGGLPFTILFDEKGGVSYFRQGKVNVESVRAKIAGLTAPATESAQPAGKPN